MRRKQLCGNYCKAAVMNYILDLDGTLMNTIEDLGNAINHALSEFGFASFSREEVKNFVGNGSVNFVNRSLGEHQEKFNDVYKSFVKYYSEHCTENVVPYPGVLEFLEKHSGRCAVLTNKPIDMTLQILRKFDLEKHFVQILGEGNAPERKPSPLGIFKIIEDANWDKKETIMIGDDIPDIGAAKAAGIKVAVLLSGFGRKQELEEANPDYLLESLLSCQAVEDNFSAPWKV